MSDTVCSQIDHQHIGLYVWGCHHLREVCARVTVGTSDQPEGGPTLQFGPFDTPTEATEELLRLLRPKLRALFEITMN